MTENITTDLSQLEFHYVVSCKGGVWYLVEEDPFMPNGTIYDYDNHQWIIAPDSTEDDTIENLDIDQYRMLSSVLRQLTMETKWNTK